MIGFAAVEAVQPKLTDMPERLRAAAVEVGGTLGALGHQTWVVGGAVRDLAIGRAVSDVDLTTDASPEAVESAFSQTVPLGKRFGTVLVKLSGLGLEVTTLRAEGGYTDNRRPDQVEFGTSVEEDATRRDFTCNAMYLDAESGDFLDPVHGLDDLEAGVLRAVGDASIRFSEDGLRIFRLARFAAELGLDPVPETLEGARASLASLQGVSAERILAELGRGLTCERGDVMLELLSDLGVHARLYPEAIASAGSDSVTIARSLPRPLGLIPGLLLFVDPDPLDHGSAGRRARTELVLAGLEALKPSKELRMKATSIWGLCCELEACCGDGAAGGQVRRWMQEDAWECASALAVACARARGEDPLGLEQWREARAAMTEDELFPDPWVDADLLRESGCPPGPRWRELMDAGLLKQLGGDWDARSDAEAWLRQQLEG